jgi:carbamoyltransferase
MDYLVVGNYIIAKHEQPALAEDVDWRVEYALD